MRNVKFRPLQRFATEGRVVNNSIVSFEVAKNRCSYFPVGSIVEMRLAHIIATRDGKTAR